MRPVPVSSIAVLVTACASLAQTSHELSSSRQTRKTCDTTYDGPPGGSFFDAENWTNGLPGPDQVACSPDDQLRVGSLTPSEPQAGGSDDPRYGSNPPPPTASGSCCLGSTCLETDAFDCRELDGYFLERVGPCSEFVCDTGVCCKQDAECVDDDGGGGPMDEELCDIMGGSYLGGAACGASDPCERFRIPEGFEITELTPGMEARARRHPRLNNCGQVVVHIGTETDSWDAEIYLYDNGLLTQITDDGLGNVFPDVNDRGTMVWDRRIDPQTRQVVISREGDITPLASGSDPHSPRVKNLDHVVWDLHSPEPCTVSAYKCDIYFYDGHTVEEIFDDGLSNQVPVINDRNDIAWTAYTFPCDGGMYEWTSEKILYSNGGAAVLPSAVETPQSGDIDNFPRVAWGSFDLVEVWQDGQTTPLTDGHIPGLNDRGDLAYSFKTTYTPWQLWLYRDGQFSRISKDIDIDDLIDNARPEVNNDGEIAWWWMPNGALSPSGTRFMRRIRNGDVDFDGDVDIDDFAPMPGCWTGPVVADGLCQCRFFDIDHDRDIDYDDFDLFMRVYTGPLEDCNENEILDLHDLIEGTSKDCNLNGIPDECDLSEGGSQDLDGDGLLDECCMPCAPAQGDTVGAKNRYLSFTAGESDQPLAIRVTFTDLPASFEALEGQSMWVGQPREYCENAGQGPNTLPEDCMPVDGRIWATFKASTLECQPYYTDWSEERTVYVYHAAIVPGGTYHLQTIKEGCGAGWEGNYSAPLIAGTSIWGDVVRNCTTNPCGPADGVVGIPTDVTAVLDKFKNLGPPALVNAAILKVRADLDVETPNQRVDISDVTCVVDAFRGDDYPFLAPPSPVCP